MPSQDDAQTNFIDTINYGPERLDPSLFFGPPERIILGLKAHANTISHARLLALEETFPLTRQHLGDATFNKITRDFVETDFARASDASRIGLNFADFLRDPVAAELAQIEWAWLQSYHAAEAVPITLGDLAALDESALLALRVAAHPATRVVTVTRPIAADLVELAGQQPSAILVARPDVEVLLIAIDATQAEVFRAATGKNATLGNLLSVAIEQADDTDPLGPVMMLIGAGALVVGG